MDTIKIEYYGIGDKGATEDYINFDHFIQSLENEFEVTVDRKIGGLGGGMYDFFLQIITNEELKNIALSIIGTGIYDFSKTIFKKIKSCIIGVEKLRSENENNTSLFCSKMKIEFHDISLFISIQGRNIDMNLFESIFQHLVKNLSFIEHSCGTILEIYIPIVEDINLPKKMFKISKFNTIPDFGYIDVEDDYILHYWGILSKSNKFFRYDLHANKIKHEKWHKGYV